MRRKQASLLVVVVGRSTESWIWVDLACHRVNRMGGLGEVAASLPLPRQIVIVLLCHSSSRTLIMPQGLGRSIRLTAPCFEMEEYKSKTWSNRLIICIALTTISAGLRTRGALSPWFVLESYLACDAWIADGMRVSVQRFASSSRAPSIVSRDAE